MPYFAPYVYREYPKWLRRAGHADVLVEDAEAEAAQLVVWGDEQLPALPQPTETRNKLLDGDVITFAGDDTERVVRTGEPKRKGGWPKGRKRGTSTVAVN